MQVARGIDPPVEELIKAARGETPADLLIKEVEYVNLFTGEIYRASIGVYGGRIVYVVSEDRAPEARKTFDGRGLYAVPGLVDSHLHIESSMLIPSRFAEAVLPHGVTTVAIDPHEIANVLGKRGVKYMLEGSRGLPLKVYVLVPTCVPPLPGHETAGAKFDARDVEEMLRWERVIGLGEVMDFGGVVNLHPRIIEILKVGRDGGMVIDGHTFLEGLDLNAYVAAGVEADHENFNFEEALKKLRLGMLVKLRAPYLLNVEEFVKGFNSLPNPSGFLLVTDDILPDNLMRDGHLDFVVRSFIEAGMDPVETVKAASLRPALHLKLFDRGVVAPGKLADVVLLKSLERFDVHVVFADGRLVARDGRLVEKIPVSRFPEEAKKTVHVGELRREDFMIRVPREAEKVKARVIEFQEPLVPADGGDRGAEFLQSILTRFVVEEFPVKDGYVDVGERAVIVVKERHGRNGGTGRGIVKNSGMREGAVASTVAHDTHNLLVMGRNPDDMLHAARHVAERQGGIAVARRGELIASIELPVAGLMSEESPEVVAEKFGRVREAFREIGLRDHPYAPIFFFIALPVIPNAKITDKGLFDVLAQKPVSLFLD